MKFKSVLIDGELPNRADYEGENIPVSREKLGSAEFKKIDDNDSVEIYELESFKIAQRG
jgi:pyrimidine operon attenuation protein/uracil phosphoribosyltransferase